MLLLRLQREPSDNGATFSALYLNDIFQCWGLEDAIREQPGVVVASWKIAGKTAIPAGRYQIDLTLSQRFGRVLPLLLDVPGFSGIRIHSGNSAADTEGCILVGQGRNDSQETITASKLAFDDLLVRLHAAKSIGDPIWIDVLNPPARHVTARTPDAISRV